MRTIHTPKGNTMKQHNERRLEALEKQTAPDAPDAPDAIELVGRNPDGTHTAQVVIWRKQEGRV